MTQLFIVALIIFSSFPVQVGVVRAEDSGPELRITEFMPNPEGSDASYEWVEVFNSSTDSIQLENYKLDELSLPEFLLKPDEYLVIAKNLEALLLRYPEIPNAVTFSSLSLKNSSDTIIITNLEDDVIDSISYTESIEVQSIIRNIEISENCDELMQSTEPTPGFENPESCAGLSQLQVQITEVYFEPEFSLVEIQNISESEIDFSLIEIFLDTELLVHTCELVKALEFCIVEIPLVELKESFEIELYIDAALVKSIELEGNYSKSLIGESFIIGVTPSIGQSNEESYEVEVSEIFPSPDTDQAEWIEIFNYGIVPIDVSGWYFIDKAGQINYAFVEKQILDPAEYIVVPALALNNSGDEFVLFTGEDFEVFSVSYESVAKGESVGFKDNEYIKTSLPTPGLENIYPKAESVAEENNTPIEVTKTPTVKSNTSIHTYKQSDSSEKLVGRLVQIEGEIVGNFGSSFDVQMFDQKFRVTASGIDLPEKSKGDFAKVVGLLEIDKEIVRIRPRSTEDVSIFKSEVISVPTPADSKTNLSKIEDDFESILGTQSLDMQGGSIPSLEYYPLNNPEEKENEAVEGSESTYLDTLQRYYLYPLAFASAIGAIYVGISYSSKEFRDKQLIYFKRMQTYLKQAI